MQLKKKKRNRNLVSPSTVTFPQSIADTTAEGEKEEEEV
jgi:hypothetical protein